MKILPLLFLFCCTPFIAETQEVVFNAPLGDMEGGIPFTGSGTEISVAGFSVTDEGYYYLSGKPAKLKKFKIDGELIYKKSVDISVPAGIAVVNDKIYALDLKTNRLLIFQRENGHAVESIKFPASKINSHWFTCSTLVVEMVLQKNFSVENPFQYVVFHLNGERKHEAENIYGLDVKCFSQKIVDEGIWFLGKYDKKFCFQAYDYENSLYKFLLLDEACKISARANVASTVVGQMFYGAPQEHWRLCGGALYILRRKDANAEILKISLKELLGKAANAKSQTE